MALIVLSIEYDTDTGKYILVVKHPDAHCEHCKAVEAAMVLRIAHNAVADAANRMAQIELTEATPTNGKPH
jgi:hypothetical protein